MIVLNRKLSKAERIKGQQIVEERVQLVLEYLEMNKVLGYAKYDILMELELLLALMRKYGVCDNDTLQSLLNSNK